MKHALNLGLTVFLSGAGAALLDVVTTGDSVLSNPKHTASLIVAAGLAGVVNLLRRQPQSNR